MVRIEFVNILAYLPKSEPKRKMIFLDLVDDISREDDKYILEINRKKAEEYSQLDEYFDIWDTVMFKAEIFEYGIHKLFLEKYKK